MILIAYIVSMIVALPAAAHWIRPPKPIDRMTLGARERWLEHVRAHYAYVARYGNGRPRRSHRHALGWVRRELARVEAARLETLGPAAAICAVFRPCAQALAVARCESELDTGAQNGQYLGLFQMGEYARSRYGHSATAIGQARAAHAYYLDAGWSPWACA